MAIQIDLSTSQYGTPFAGAYLWNAMAAVLRQRSVETKFSVMLDVAGYATSNPDDDTRDVDFRRYNADLASVEAMTGDTFLDKCYTWVMTQDDMAGSVAV